MAPLPDLPPTTIRGPRRLPLLGPSGSLMRFFAEPVAQLFSLHRRYGMLAAVGDRDSALICAFGAEHNRSILSDSHRFEDFADVPIKEPPGSAPLRLNTALTSMKGDTHKRQTRMMMSEFSPTSLQGYHDDLVAVAEKQLKQFSPGQTVDLAAEMTELSLCVARHCLFGLDVAKDIAHAGARFQPERWESLGPRPTNVCRLAPARGCASALASLHRPSAPSWRSCCSDFTSSFAPGRASAAGGSRSPPSLICPCAWSRDEMRRSCVRPAAASRNLWSCRVSR